MNFEQGFADVERAAGAVLRATRLLAAAARVMVRAAQEGDIAAIGRSAQRISEAAEAATQDAANARSAWPYSAQTEEDYLKEQYAAELVAAAQARGLEMQARDGLLVAYPSIIRVLPAERVVRINKTRSPGVRPSRLVAKLKAAQERKSRGSIQPFLEALYAAYLLVRGKEGTAGSVALGRIYRAFTLLPGSASDYSRDDFARDLFTLDRSGINQTRAGARISLPASTGTKDSRDTFVCVAPNGEIVTYYALKFSEDRP